MLSVICNKVTAGVLFALIIALSHVTKVEAQGVSAQNFDRLVVFGDSLSDTGNLASVTVDFPFPFFQNRISNGPILVDYLAADLGLQALASRHVTTSNGGDNFAISGGNILGSDTEDLSSQISAFLSRESVQPRGVSSALFFIMMGGNDLRDVRSLRSASEASVRIDAIITTLDAQFSRLYQAGARNFLVPNVADIGAIPESIARRSSDPDISARARRYVLEYNQKLELMLQTWAQKPNTSLRSFDLFTEFDRVLNNASSFGFTRTEVGCFQIDGFSFDSECLFGTRFDRFVFFDNIHPSARLNEIISTPLLAQIPVQNSDTSSINISPILQLLLD